jgi:hypothetical protein
MKGKTEAQILEDRSELVKQIEARGDIVVNTVFKDFKLEGNIPLKYLARSITAIADVDKVVFMHGWDKARGCKIEHEVCKQYGIEIEYA